MAQVVLRVQGADPAHTTFDVLLDSIDDADHALPVYKMSFGEEGVDAGLVSRENPFPVVTQQSANILQLDKLDKIIELLGMLASS